MTPFEAAATVIETCMEPARAPARPWLLANVVPTLGATSWRHYPDRDARDVNCGSRWYYHRHAESSRDPREHGHFHLFLDRSQLPSWLTPRITPSGSQSQLATVSHIAALSVDESGTPLSWFTVNRFVTNEFLYPAHAMVAHLPKFSVENAAHGPLVGRFLTAMVALYRKEITQLLFERDLRQVALEKKLGPIAYEKSSGVEVISRLDIDLEAKLEAIKPV